MTYQSCNSILLCEYLPRLIKCRCFHIGAHIINSRTDFQICRNLFLRYKSFHMRCEHVRFFLIGYIQIKFTLPWLILISAFSQAFSRYRKHFVNSLNLMLLLTQTSDFNLNFLDLCSSGQYEMRTL